MHIILRTTFFLQSPHCVIIIGPLVWLCHCIVLLEGWTYFLHLGVHFVWHSAGYALDSLRMNKCTCPMSCCGGKGKADMGILVCLVPESLFLVLSF